MMKPAVLVLADGTCFEGVAFGADTPVFGEIVFNTSMTGYQEILSDPSYAGQIVTLTVPHVGNYGTNLRDMESNGIQAAGLVVRSLSTTPSNWQSEKSLNDWLKECGVAAIADIDTRSLTRHLRDGGVLAAAIVPGATAADVDAVLVQMRAQPAYGTVDWVSRVATQEPVSISLDRGGIVNRQPFRKGSEDVHVVVMDFGVKHSILRNLCERGMDVTLAPPGATTKQILDLEPDGVLVSNGPGDPAVMDGHLAVLREVAEQLPTWGICLGHQLLARAFGATTFKLPFGHRGPNQPVLDHASERVLITSQNHGYAVEPESLPGELECTQHNLNDDTVEAFRHRDLKVNAVQYHPEAGPGPHDAVTFFDEFRDVLSESH